MKTLTKMSNLKSPGKENITVELLNNAPYTAHQQISMIMNNIFSKHELNDFDNFSTTKT